MVSLSALIHPWDVDYRTPSFTGAPPHVKILSIIEIIQHKKEDLGDDMVLNMIEELNERRILGGFNQS